MITKAKESIKKADEVIGFFNQSTQHLLRHLAVFRDTRNQWLCEQIAWFEK